MLSINSDERKCWIDMRLKPCPECRNRAIDAALKVLVLTPHIRAYLVEKDPMALKQAEEALK
jgi:hypothetical protein